GFRDHRLFDSLTHLNRPFLERGEVRLGSRTVRGPTLDHRALVTQCDALLHRRFFDMRVDPHASALTFARTDTELLLDDGYHGLALRIRLAQRSRGRRRACPAALLPFLRARIDVYSAALVQYVGRTIGLFGTL